MRSVWNLTQGSQAETIIKERGSNISHYLMKTQKCTPLSVFRSSRDYSFINSWIRCGSIVKNVPCDINSCFYTTKTHMKEKSVRVGKEWGRVWDTVPATTVDVWIFHQPNQWLNVCWVLHLTLWHRWLYAKRLNSESNIYLENTQ